MRNAICKKKTAMKALSSPAGNTMTRFITKLMVQSLVNHTRDLTFHTQENTQKGVHN
jgi:hypothetical protein